MGLIEIVIFQALNDNRFVVASKGLVLNSVGCIGNPKAEGSEGNHFTNPIHRAYINRIKTKIES